MANYSHPHLNLEFVPGESQPTAESLEPGEDEWGKALDALWAEWGTSADAREPQQEECWVSRGRVQPRQWVITNTH